MIAQVVLLAWILFSAGLFALLKPVRAFSLTYVVGMLVLPVAVVRGDSWEGAIAFTMSMRIDKLVACNLGAMIGTALFAPQVIRRYRFNWIDAAYLGVLGGIFLTSIANGLGPYDGVSGMVSEGRLYVPLIVLAKMHLSSVQELYQFLRTMVAGAFVYSAVCVAEFRLSPRLHTDVYGYFQHAFDQHMRYGWFRPIGMFNHALQLAGFMSVSAVLAVWLWWRKLMPPLWGLVPAPVVCGAIIVGLLCTLTLSGYVAFGLGIGLLAAIYFNKVRWLLLALPLVMIVWMAGRYTDVFDASLLIRMATFVDPQRADSIIYRLEAEEQYLAAGKQQIFFGMSSTLAMARTAEAGGNLKAVDAFWLIQLAFNGLVGLAGQLIVWTAAVWVVFRRWSSLRGDTLWLAAFVAVALGVQVVDFLFNSFPSTFLMIANVGVISVLAHQREAARAARHAATRLVVTEAPGSGATLGSMQPAR